MTRSTTTASAVVAPEVTTAPEDRLSPAVWAIAFACAISYMGIGLVDPILPTIARDLDASAGQTELLFSTYLFVTAITMFFTSWVSSRIGRRATLILGLALVVTFAVASGASPTVNWVIGFRGGWGVGNALFVSTALAAILGATANTTKAVMLYEAAMGAGMALGPLLGGTLGNISWRGPFFGTAALMALALVGIAVRLPREESRGAPRELAAPFRAIGRADFRVFLAATLVYNFAYFIMLAYAPFPIDNAATVSGRTFTPLDLGLVFFGWGGLLALCSVLIAPRLTRRFGVRQTLMATMLVLTALLAALVALDTNLTAQIVGTIVGGGLVGIANTAMTEAAMEATDLPRDVASSTYSGFRFIGGAIGPTLTGPLSAAGGVAAPYVAAAIAMAVTAGILLFEHVRLARPHESATAEADIIGRAD